jgi:hypothetical protein
MGIPLCRSDYAVLRNRAVFFGGSRRLGLTCIYSLTDEVCHRLHSLNVFENARKPHKYGEKSGFGSRPFLA